MSSDTLPGLPTQEQILEMRAKGVQPTREGGFGYLRGPDGAMIENAQAGETERFNHVHMNNQPLRQPKQLNTAQSATNQPATLPQDTAMKSEIGAADVATVASGSINATAQVAMTVTNALNPVPSMPR